MPCQTSSRSPEMLVTAELNSPSRPCSTSTHHSVVQQHLRRRHTLQQQLFCTAPTSHNQIQQLSDSLYTPSMMFQAQSLICQSSMMPPGTLGSVAAATATFATCSTDTGGTKPAPTMGRAASCLACPGGNFFSSRSTGPKMAPNGRVMAGLNGREGGGGGVGRRAAGQGGQHKQRVSVVKRQLVQQKARFRWHLR